MKQMNKILLSALGLLIGSLSGFAQDYVAIAKDGNVYDEANAKYITINQNNDDVSVIPGMVFSTSQHTPGWYKIEYSPGLHAFIPDQITASGLKTLQPGNFDVKNNPGQKITVINSGEDWSASVDNKNYKGIKTDEILVFIDPSNNSIAFSLVDLGQGPIAISYDNSVTKFF